MARRVLTVALEPILAGIAEAPDHDDVDAALLDATLALLAAHGLRRWSIDDVADRAGIGRTTVYRRFATRDVLVHAALARELRRSFSGIAVDVAAFARIEDRVVEGMLAALALARDGVLVDLVAADPATFLPLLTTGAGPLVATAAEVLVDLAEASGAAVERRHAALVAEALVRLALSFLLTPSATVPLDDPDAARAALHALVDPLLAPPPGAAATAR